MYPLRLSVAATAAVALVVALGSSAAAVQFYYEPFLTGASPAAGQYTTGLLDTTLDAPATGGQNPTVGPTPFLTGQWDAVFSGPNGMVQEPGLSFIGAPSTGGSQISNPDSRPRRHLSSPLTSTTDGTYYIGFLANYGQGFYDDGIQGNDMGYRAVELWDEAGGFLFSIAYNTFNGGGGPAQQDPSTAKLYLDGFGYQILEGAPDSFVEDGATHLIVLRMGFSSVAGSDTVSVYLDPKTTEEPVIPNATLTAVDLTLGAIGGMSIYGGNGISPVFDELRVGDSFIDVLPDFPLPGDTNGDDLVNIVDYQNILQHLNLSGQAVPNTPLLHPDVTGDGRVTIADYRLWKDRRTDLTPGAGSASGARVPEPSSLMMVLTATVALAGSARRMRDGQFTI
jgi:hypothetical protein